eukprot:TRINITY_DN5708_c0_g1_i10.p1 TRINITY_DN5708_c0_g1~~TRINITY_DN5708_c0_g1_i10.p1  ORF type:complete len:301 (+),score=58.19 TRINITY_DN5708_c0_g1_i10:472-1374(+)
MFGCIFFFFGLGSRKFQFSCFRGYQNTKKPGLPDNQLYYLNVEAHKRGINIRHLGQVRKHVCVASVKNLLLAECVARTLKNLTRGVLRQVLVDGKISTEGTYRDTVCDFLATIFHCEGYNPTSERGQKWLLYWTKTIKSEINSRFPSCVFGTEVEDNFNLTSILQMPVVIRRYAKLSGVKLSPFVDWSWAKGKIFYMTFSDVHRIKVRISYSTIVDYSKAIATLGLVKTYPDMDGEKQFGLLEKASKLFMKASARSDFDPSKYWFWSEVLIQKGILCQKLQKDFYAEVMEQFRSCIFVEE